MKWLVQFIIANILLGSQVYAVTPDWVQETGRSIRGGDIVHWGMGEADSAELAAFKARQSAIAAIIDECGGIANKAIVPRRQHIESNGNLFTAFAHVSIEFDACDHAKTRRAKREEIENPQIAADQKTYRELIGVTARKPDLADRIAKLLEAERAKTNQKLGAIDQKLDAISERLQERQEPQVIVVKQPIYQATSSQRSICQIQAQAMLNAATLAAADNYGNMAGLPAYNQFMAQQEICRSMQ